MRIKKHYLRTLKATEKKTICKILFNNFFSMHIPCAYYASHHPQLMSLMMSQELYFLQGRISLIQFQH